MLRGLGEGNAWNLSIRQATEKVEQQVKKVKGKWTERKRSDTRRRTARAPGADGTGQGARAEASEREASAPRVIRSARYAVKPMSVEDAALRMEHTTEAFLVFRNPESESVSIVYRRKDGNLGLIEPD
jgi:putative sigma-54 modulation protein